MNDPSNPRSILPQDIPILDYDGAMKRLGNDAELYREFITFYDEDSALLLSDIQAAINSCNMSQLRHSAHSLKGLVANLGALRVAEVAFQLEKIGISNSEPDTPAELIHLQQEMESLDAALNNYRIPK